MSFVNVQSNMTYSIHFTYYYDYDDRSEEILSSLCAV